MRTLRTLLGRLWPPRLRRTPELTGEERRLLWATVGDQDLCLRAVLDLLGDMIEGNAGVLLNPETPKDKQEVARARVSVACDILRQIEQERAQSKK